MYGLLHSMVRDNGPRRCLVTEKEEMAGHKRRTIRQLAESRSHLGFEVRYSRRNRQFPRLFVTLAQELCVGVCIQLKRSLSSALSYCISSSRLQCKQAARCARTRLFERQRTCVNTVNKKQACIERSVSSYQSYAPYLLDE